MKIMLYCLAVIAGAIAMYLLIVTPASGDVVLNRMNGNFSVSFEDVKAMGHIIKGLGIACAVFLVGALVMTISDLDKARAAAKAKASV